jgi:type III pantothenate kinase
MILLIDIGNTNTHIGIADAKGITRERELPTRATTVPELIDCFRTLGAKSFSAAALCSVVPDQTSSVQTAVLQACGFYALELNAGNVIGIGIDYPEPDSIGPDRLANAIAARKHFGAPSVVVDFGTAVTFDVVNARGRYVGGIIAPGIAAMTDYLHEKTALLPKVEIAEPKSVIGRSTREAMLSGAVLGYRGLIRELIHGLRDELGAEKLPVVATGGYAKLIASRLPLIDAVDPNLTLEGLRLFQEGMELASSAAKR